VLRVWSIVTQYHRLFWISTAAPQAASIFFQFLATQFLLKLFSAMQGFAGFTYLTGLKAMATKAQQHLQRLQSKKVKQ
jgi:hypothetical protein